MESEQEQTNIKNEGLSEEEKKERNEALEALNCTTFLDGPDKPYVFITKTSHTANGTCALKTLYLS